jgi:hypothetical protein
MSHTPLEEPVHPEVHEEPEMNMPVEEVHPEVQMPVQSSVNDIPQAPPMAQPVEDIPAQTPAEQEQQPIRNFGTIFSNSPGKNSE